ncbi:protein STRUBBELIG-RECEPTOR FAMILY 8 isoform X3 [Magnolia sinica]|uniref:protein STRUBBELIG-RECEPTOR FAMILY 8 isoform X3 n=1 Tax=Magnolia sinica TaxID=86752 RepID=UPI00265A99B2|nr:protein STRUBBELIG-RECEPTOR FAMILY 8 isoform X3 [Magnolia sinica]
MNSNSSSAFHFMAAAFLFQLLLPLPIHAATDPSDVQALEVIFSSLNNPLQLSGWRSTGGDPCGESWKGISCAGPAVIAIQVSGLGLNGTMGYLLSNLFSLRTLDLSNNNIHDTIPYQLPPNLTYLNLASNNFSGNLPYSISNMVALNYLNASHNSLSMSVGDVFTDLEHLSILNIANNHFTGWIPKEFNLIPNLQLGGNSFDNGPAPPPPPYTPPPPNRSHNNRNHSGIPTNTPRGSNGEAFRPDRHDSKKSLTTGAIVGIVVGSVLAVCALLALFFCFWKYSKVKDEKEDKTQGSLGSLPVGTATNREMQEQRAKSVSPITSLKPPPSEKLMGERVHVKNGSGKRPRAPITAASYSVASLQTVTNSFSQECLVGEGSLGRVYRAELNNGKVLAVKKIDSAALTLQEEDDFLEAVSNMSRLRHPNITSLLGYCAEHGQRLLVYEYIENGTLHDMLHFVDDSSKALTWNARVKIALGTARALEYLHEVCLPSVVHRNLKSANILLDEDLNPHLSDCGLAALTPNTERQISTQMVGSFGYSAPEFAMSGLYTVKSDVYSFGVVMLELLTGRKPLDSSRIRSEQSLVRWAAPQLHDIDALAKMVDPALNGIYPAKSLSRFADIIALCVQPEPEFRPPMSEVVQTLVRLLQRASVIKRRSSDESGFSYKIPEHEATEFSF